MIERIVNFWTFLTLGSFVGFISIGILSDFELDRFLVFRFDQQDKSTLAGIFALSALYIFYLLLYKIVPNILVSLKCAASGALVSTFLLWGAGRVYSKYVLHFTRFSAIYDVLAALPILLLWIFVIWVITLIGALITFRLEQGIFIADTLDETRRAEDVREHHYGRQIQVLTPVLIFFAISRNYEEANGLGIDGQTLIKELSSDFFLVSFLSQE